MAVGMTQISRQPLRANPSQRIADDDIFFFRAHSGCKGTKNYAQFHYALQQKENNSSPLTFLCLFFDGVSYDLWYFCNNINNMNHKRFNLKIIIPSYRPPKMGHFMKEV